MVTINELVMTGVDLSDRKDTIFVLQPPSITLPLCKFAGPVRNKKPVSELLVPRKELEPPLPIKGNGF